MLLFMAKSALCIGAVAAMASGMGIDVLATAAGRGARAAAEGAGRSCLRSAPCRAAGVGALLASARAVPPDAGSPSAQGARPREMAGGRAPAAAAARPERGQAQPAPT